MNDDPNSAQPQPPSDEAQQTKETGSASAGVTQVPPDDGSGFTTELYQGMNQPDSMSSTPEDVAKMHTLIKKRPQTNEGPDESRS